MSKELTPKQQRFVDEWLVDMNGTRAYLRSYPNCKSEKAAAVEAVRLLSNPSIQEAIQKGREKLSAQTGLTQAWVLERLKIEAEYQGEGSTHSGRVRAVELIGKHLGMFIERQRVEAGEGTSVLMIVGPDPKKVLGLSE